MSTIETVTHQPEITAENVLRLFPEVNTTLIGGSHNSATSDNALQGYDEEQIRLMDEVCIVLDNNDVPIGSATKKLCKSLLRLRLVGRLGLTCFRPLDGKH
jgi:isopentenyl-diphosphate delta-isomerase